MWLGEWAEGGERVGKGRARDAALSATTLAGCGRGREGRVIGERVEGPSPEGDGRATDGARMAHGPVTEVRPRDEDAGNVTLPPVLSNSHDRAVDLEAAIGASRSTARFRGLFSGPERARRFRKG
jgi:hypothetical protein